MSHTKRSNIPVLSIILELSRVGGYEILVGDSTEREKTSVWKTKKTSRVWYKPYSTFILLSLHNIHREGYSLTSSRSTSSMTWLSPEPYIRHHWFCVFVCLYLCVWKRFPLPPLANWNLKYLSGHYENRLIMIRGMDKGAEKKKTRRGNREVEKEKLGCRGVRLKSCGGPPYHVQRHH